MQKTGKLEFLKKLVKELIFWPTCPAVVRAIAEPILCRAGRFPRSEEIQLSDLRRVLVIRLDEIGDMVLMSPFLRELRRNLPQALITLVLKPGVFNLVEKCPYVQEVLTFDCMPGKFVAPYVRHWRALNLARQHLWPRRFDLAILPRWDADLCHGTTLAYFSGARRRLGWSENVCPSKQSANRGFDGLLTDILDERQAEHELLRNLDVLRYLGGTIKDESLEIWLTEEDKAEAARLLHDSGSRRPGILVGLGPGALIPGKRWPLGRFAEVASWVQKNFGAKIIIIGGKEDEPLGRELRTALGEEAINLAGKTTLRQAAAVLSHCRFYIGNDSGPMHLGAAANVPIIDICCSPQDGDPRHYQSPRRFGPWGVPSRILQPERALPPCTDACISDSAHCILGVTVERVQVAVRDLLSELDGDLPVSTLFARKNMDMGKRQAD